MDEVSGCLSGGKLGARRRNECRKKPKEKRFSECLKVVCVRVCVFLGRFCLLLFAHSVSSRRSCFRLFNSMEGADSEEPEE